ncbi:MAG: CPBP family intramembrane metalloprotease, partial [Verrucomicrobiae bacterium]|nr:CPBP family intramembrane metalloprotease [Verrucomicrobiae bacterium]
PPVIATATEGPAGSPAPPWRSLIMLLLMGMYPLIVGGIGFFLDPKTSDSAALPSTVRGLLLVSAVNLGLFLLLFLTAAAAGRPSARELFAVPLPGLRTWLLGAVYSVALRVGTAVLALAALLAAGVAVHLKGGSLESFAAARPRVENVLDPHALRDPAYLLLSVTWVSFIIAGLREELWRAVVFAGLLRWRPQWRDGLRGRLILIGVTAVIFGFGHLPQGWTGVGLTTILGAGLGAILLVHRSLWMAVLAHGFFDATSFLFLRLADAYGLLEQILTP